MNRLIYHPRKYPPFNGNSYVKTPSYIPPRSVINAKLKFEKTKCPVEISGVPKFEKQNANLSINVFGWNKGLYPLYILKQITLETREPLVIDLLLITDANDPETHYVWIKDLVRYKTSNAPNWYICGFRLDNIAAGTANKSRFHCHITRTYGGAVYNSCNIKLCIYPYKTKVPAVFRNLWGYDGHLIISALGKSGEASGKINCIPNNMEKYMTFSVGQPQFIES